MTQQRISHKDFFISVTFALLSTLCLAIAAGLGKYLTSMGPLQLVLFFRFLFPFVLLLLFFILRRQKVHIRKFWPYLLRSILVIGAQYSLFYVLAKGNVLLATLLYSTSGLFSPLLSKVLLNIKIPKKTTFSIIISFIGVVISLGTWENILSYTSLIGLLSGLLTAGGQIIQHHTSKSENTMTTNLMLYGLCAQFSLFILFLFPHTWSDFPSFVNQNSFFLFGILLIFSIFSIMNQTFKNSAFKRVNKVASLTPFLYATLLFSGIIDWIWYGIIPQIHTIIGVVIIIMGGIIMSIRKIKT